MRKTATRKTGYACQTRPADPQLHTWKISIAAGWFTCAGCGKSGYCPVCLAQAGVTTTPNSLHVMPMDCSDHMAPSWEM